VPSDRAGARGRPVPPGRRAGRRGGEADDAVEAAIAAKDDAAFTAALDALVDTIERVGQPVPDDEFVPSDVIVPDRGTTLADAAAYHDDDGEGLIPG
jgi:hypothetical protein